MPARKDLTGQIFGPLTVLKLDEEKTKQQKRGFWICSCNICNNNHSIRTDTLKTIKYCPNNCHKGKIKDETGNRYGKLTVLKQDENRQNKNQNIFWICQCDCGTILSVNGIDLRRNHTISCGCVHSKGEDKIISFLNKNNILYEKEKTFSNCIFPETNGILRFDFYLPDYDILIEYNGEQHYHTNNSGWNTETALKETQKRDNYKKQWCKDNNKTLIVIPFTDFEKININSLLGKEKKYIYYEKRFM